MIAVVALLVIGPERLPRVARTVGLWIGRARRFVGSVKADIEQELRAEELKRILDEQAKSNPLEEIVEETRKAVQDVERDTGKPVTKTRDPVASSIDTTSKRPDDEK